MLVFNEGERILILRLRLGSSQMSFSDERFGVAMRNASPPGDGNAFQRHFRWFSRWTIDGMAYVMPKSSFNASEKNTTS